MSYTKKTIDDIRKRALKIKGAKRVRHIFPRAYCVVKIAPKCAVFSLPWPDAEKHLRETTRCGDNNVMVYVGVDDIKAGDWCALAYVITETSGQFVAFPYKSEKK